MKCRKCRADVADDFKFCPRCGAQLHTEQATKARGNGTGSVYKRGKTWVAAVTVGYYTDEDGKVRRSVRRKMGFKTKREALEYLPTLAKAPAKQRPRTFQQVYDLWQPTHQASRSTLLCYQAAMGYFRPVWGQPMADITVDDLQECMDECPKGKRTRQNMKTLAGLLYKFAIPRQLASLNMGEYVKVHADDTAAREGLPLDVLAAIEAHVGDVEGADYVVNMAAVIPPRSDADPAASEHCNERGAVALADAVRAMPRQAKFIHISTIALYGCRNQLHPFARVGDPRVISPFDIYSLHKLRAERYVLEAGLENWVILRQTAMLHAKML